MRLGLMKINGYLLIVVRVCSNQAHSKRGAFEQVFAKNTRLRHHFFRPNRDAQKNEEQIDCDSRNLANWTRAEKLMFFAGFFDRSRCIFVILSSFILHDPERENGV